MFGRLKTIARNALRGKNYKVIAHKCFARIRPERSADALNWAQNICEPYAPYLHKLDPGIWDETQKESLILKDHGRAVLKKIPHDLGGGGNTDLLYFMVRFFKPRTVLETGVAAGWSSQAILTALDKNESGTLYSSDFPYFRIENPEQYIGEIGRAHV